MATTWMGFTTSIARSRQALCEASDVRAEAYGHHLPAMGATLAQPDVIDLQPGSTVLVCRDKASGQVAGTARLQRNQPAPLQIERSVDVPEALAGQHLAEITRLAIRPGADVLMRPMLVKACYLYAVASQIRWLVIGARSPALIRIYRGLGFADLLGEGRQVPLAHAGGLPHSVLAFNVVAAERTWHAARHSLYSFMVETFHPDLQLTGEPEFAEAAVAQPDAPRPAGRPQLRKVA